MSTDSRGALREPSWGTERLAREWLEWRYNRLSLWTLHRRYWELWRHRTRCGYLRTTRCTGHNWKTISKIDSIFMFLFGSIQNMWYFLPLISGMPPNRSLYDAFVFMRNNSIQRRKFAADQVSANVVRCHSLKIIIQLKICYMTRTCIRMTLVSASWGRTVVMRRSVWATVPVSQPGQGGWRDSTIRLLGTSKI